MAEDGSSSLKVAVVGACASGKSTLVDALRDVGFDAHNVAQEHSYVPHMWQRLSRPDVLVYLDVDYDAIMIRRPDFNFKPKDLAEQTRRLAHARQHCDLYLDTTDMTPIQVQQKTLTFLEEVIRNS